jgi:hypothetical protein
MANGSGRLNSDTHLFDTSHLGRPPVFRAAAVFVP